MQFVDSLKELKVIQFGDVIDVFGIDDFHLARYTVTTDPVDDEIISAVAYMGTVYPMRVELFNTANAQNVAEIDLCVLLNRALAEQHKEPGDLLVIHQAVCPLTLTTERGTMVLR